jgi:hypothetical protein
LLVYCCNLLTAVGSIQEELKDKRGASETYSTQFPFLSEILSQSIQSRELRRSIEELLFQSCLYLSHGQDPAQIGPSLTSFRLLSRAGPSVSPNLPRRRVWRLYYEKLSILVSNGLVYRTAVSTEAGSLESRQDLDPGDCFTLSHQQYEELKHVEANYERLLMQETRFPRADEANAEVRSWIDLAMSNWRVVCGPDWSDVELGKGGKEDVGRKTLDVSFCPPRFLSGFNRADPLPRGHQNLSFFTATAVSIHYSRFSGRIRSCFQSI